MIIALVAALLMEPFAALAHRLVMHRPLGWGWHRSHHQRRAGPDGSFRARTSAERKLERNDLFPLVFAVVTVLAMAVGNSNVRAAGAGVTAYGVAYALVHDVCVHGRLSRRAGRPVLPTRWLRWLARSHAVHHRTGAAPYGFLLPIVPRSARAATDTLRAVETRALAENTS